MPLHAKGLIWTEFRRRYFAELDAKPEELAPLAKLGRRRVTLVFGSREERLNNAHALKEYLGRRPKRPRRHA